jgi:hypothetical protein
MGLLSLLERRTLKEREVEALEKIAKAISSKKDQNK